MSAPHMAPRPVPHCLGGTPPLPLADARRGAPVSTYTVARELGHESEAMVRRVYAHLGEVRHRSEVVEYRVAQHREQIGERLRKLGIVTGTLVALREPPKRKRPAITDVTAGRSFRTNGPG